MMEVPACAREGCETPAKTQGLCNTHYMARWREEQKRMEAEIAAAVAMHGSVTDYICEGNADVEDAEDCEETPVLWWVTDGDAAKATALCQKHADATVERLRFDIRRLEMKT